MIVHSVMTACIFVMQLAADTKGKLQFITTWVLF